MCQSEKHNIEVTYHWDGNLFDPHILGVTNVHKNAYDRIVQVAAQVIDKTCHAWHVFISNVVFVQTNRSWSKSGKHLCEWICRRHRNVHDIHLHFLRCFPIGTFLDAFNLSRCEGFCRSPDGVSNSRARFDDSTTLILLCIPQIVRNVQDVGRYGSSW